VSAIAEEDASAPADGGRARRLLAGLRARPNLAAALILAVLALGFVSPALVPGHVLSNSDSFWFKTPWAAERRAGLTRPANPEFDDAPAVLQPIARYVVRNLPDIPLWNPYIMGGRPLLADAQSAIFSPFSVPMYVLGFWAALAWIAALKLWVAAFGAFLLARALGQRFAGALVAGVTYGFSQWMVTWLSYPHASVWALIPWLLVAADRLVARPSLRPAVLLALGVGAQFACGHPESSFHAMLATTVFAALRAWPRRREVPLRRATAAFVGAVAAGTALAALVLLPFVELLALSADIRQRAGTAGASHTQLRYGLGIFLPDEWGRPTQTPIELFLLARAFYAGALPLLLAAAALILRPTRRRLVTLGLGVLCLMIVLGIPPVFQVVVHLPVFSSGHNGRLAILYVLCLALLAGWGLDDLLARRGSPRARRALAWTAGLVFCFPVAYALARSTTGWAALPDALRVATGFAHPPGIFEPHAREVVRGAALLDWIAAAGAGVVVVWCALRGRTRPTLLAAAAVAIVALDLARAGMGYNPAIPRSVAEQPPTAAIRLLQRANPQRYVSTGDIPQDAAPINDGLFEARGYDLPVEQRFDRLWRTRMSPEFPTQVGPYPQFIPLSLPKVTPARLATLSVLGVSHVLQPTSDGRLRVPGLRLVHDGPDARVYVNDGAQPRATVVASQQVVGSAEAALNAVGRPGFDLRRGAVTEQRVPGLPVAPAGGTAPAGSARIVRTDPDRLLVRADARRAGMLVVSDNWFPGWKATVDGKDAPIERVDYVMRGVRVGPGAHTVDFRYAPASWRIGWIVSLLTLLGLGGAWVVGGRRR
jgi:hypothetical protein